MKCCCNDWDGWRCSGKQAAEIKPLLKKPGEDDGIKAAAMDYNIESRNKGYDRCYRVES